MRTVLSTPPIACIVPDGVFDAFSWCASDTLEWRRPDHLWDAASSVTGKNPSRMAFVMHAPCDFLPRELARLHVRGLDLADEWALAPWGIDDATDLLFEKKKRPRDILWLAAESLEGLAWGLHDWAHFHSHGPFEARAWTELQCDATALAWLWQNRESIPLDEATFGRIRQDFVALSRERFQAEGIAFDEALLSRDAVRHLTDGPQVAARTIRS